MKLIKAILLSLIFTTILIWVNISVEGQLLIFLGLVLGIMITWFVSQIWSVMSGAKEDQ